MKRIASLVAALSATILAVFALVVPALGAASRGSISLDQTNVSIGDTITFTVSGVEDSHNPAVRVVCWASPGHVHVFEERQRAGNEFVLNFYRPAPDGATCTADLLREFPDWAGIARMKFFVSL